MDDVIRSLVERFQADHDLTQLKEPEAFEAFAGFCVLGSFYESEFVPDAFRMGEGGDLGIDVFGILVNGELYHDAADVQAAVDQARTLDVRIIVVQAKTSEHFDTKVLSDLADNLRHVVDPADLPYPSSAGVDGIRECLRAVYANIAKLSGGLPRLHVRYVTTGAQVDHLVRQKARSAKRHLYDTGRFETVDVRCVTRRDLRALYQRATTAVDAAFDMAKKVALARIPGVEQALLGTVSTRELVEKVLSDPNGNVRRSLFRENVRDFQGYNDVNRQIRDTLRDSGRHQRFAVLNNGITIVTRALTVVGDEVHVRDFQIVNGCQTCYVLFDERDRLTDEIQVSVRIVHAVDEDLIDGIVAATNRQTAISEADLSAREEFHRDLEDFFENQRAPRTLYYERRAKQYSARADVQKTRVITRSQLTAAYASMFLDEPAAAGRLKELQDRRRGDLFQKDQPPEAYYAAAAALYRLESLIRNESVARTYRPARFHLLTAVKLTLVGPGALPRAPRKAAEKCHRILDVVWDGNAFERLVLDLLQPLDAVMKAERAAGMRDDAMVRTQRFADRFRTEVLRRSARATP